MIRPEAAPRGALTCALAAALLTGAAASALPYLPAAAAAREVGVGDVVDRPLPRGGRLLVARAPEAPTVVARLGFPCEAAPGAVAQYAATLEEALTRALGRALEAERGRLSVEHDDASLTVVLEAPPERYSELLTLVSRALAAPRFEPGAFAPRLAAPAIDLTGARRALGPEDVAGPGRASSSAAGAAFALLLERDRGTGRAPEGTADADPLAAVRALHATTVVRAALVLALHGDLDVEAAYQLADGTTEALPPGTPGSRANAAPLVVPLTREVWVRCDPGRTAAGFGVLGAACRADAPDAAALLALEEHLTRRVEALVAGTRIAGVAFVPGFGRTGRVGAWIGGEVGGLRENAEALLATLAEAGEVDADELAVAVERARRRLALDAPSLEVLARDERLALRGAPPGWRTRLDDELRRLGTADLVEAARRHIVPAELLSAAVTRPEHLTDLAPLGLVVDVTGIDHGDTPSAPPVVADVVFEREAARPVVARLFEALGGRAAWATAGAAELGLTFFRGEQRWHATLLLDLTAPRFALRVEDGGLTLLDDTGAHWRSGAEHRTLDRAPLARDAELGALLLLHQLALEDRLDTRLTADGLLLADGDTPRGLLQLGEDGRPTAITASGSPPRHWRLTTWRPFDGRLVPTQILDEITGVRIELDACRFTERFDPNALR